MSEEGTPIEGEPSAAEASARKQGWTPKEEFKGDPDKWVDAEVFVERGKEINSILRKNNRGLEEKLDKMNETFNKFKTYHETTLHTAEKKAYDKAVADLEKKALQAVEDGDVETYSAIQDEKNNLEIPPPAPTADESNPEFDTWLSSNSWYSEDRELHVMADGFGTLFAEQGLSGRALYDAVAEKVKERAPDKFGKKRGGQSEVETGGPAAKSNGGREFSDLPAEAQKACNEFVKDGLLTKKQYLESYEWE